MKKLSKCCSAEVMLVGTGDFHDKGKICTQYYVCKNCNQPCDLEEEQSNNLTLCDSCMCMTKTILKNSPRLVCGKCLAGKVPIPVGVTEWKKIG